MAVSAREITLILRVQSAGTSNIRRLSGDLAALERGGLSFNQRFIKASQALGALGRSAQLAGGITTAALGFAANAAANLQSQTTLAATQVANNVANVQKVAATDMQGILKQMTQFPAASSDMAKALYDLYSTLNITAKQGLPLLQQVNKAAVAGGLSAQDAGNGLLTILSNFKQIPQTAAGANIAFTRLFAGVRFGRISMQQMTTALAQAAPAARIAGQSLDSMVGSLAFLTRSLGFSKASVGYARLVETLSGPQMQQGLAAMGVHIDTAGGKLKNLQDVIDILVKHFPYLERGGIKASNFFKDIGGLQSTIQARRAFSTLVTNVSGYHNVLGKTIKDNNEFKKSYAALANSLGVQWQVLLNTLKSIAIQIGLTVIPAFVEMSKPIKQAIAWFEALDPKVKDTIGRFAAFGSVALLVGGTIITLVAGLGVAVASIEALGGAASIFVAGAAVYGGLAVLAVKIYQNWSDVKDLFKRMGIDIVKVLQDIGKIVQDFISGKWSDMWSHMGDAVKHAWDGIKAALDFLKVSITKWFADFLTSFPGAITGALTLAFAKRRILGGGAGVGAIRGLDTASTALDTASILNLVGGTALPAGVMLKAAAKSGDMEKLAKYMPFLAGRNKSKVSATILQSGDMAAIAASLPMMSASNRAIGQELIARDKAAHSILNLTKARVELNRVTALSTALESKGLVVSQRIAGGLRIASGMMGGTLAEKFAVASSRTGLTAPAPGAVEAVTAAGKFAKPADVAIATQGLEQLALNATLVQKATAGAGVAFETMGSKVAGAGKGLLQFIGLGNVWVGAAVAGGVALYGVIQIMNHFNPTLDQLIAKEKQAEAAFKQSAGATAQLAQTYSQTQSALQGATSTWRSAVKEMNNAKGGTEAYRKSIQNLSSATQGYTDSAKAAKDATKALNDAMASQITQLKAIPTKSFADLAQLPAAQATLGQLAGGQQIPKAQIQAAQDIVNGAKDARAAVAAYNVALQINARDILGTVASGQKLTENQALYIAQVDQLAAQNPKIKSLQVAMQELSVSTQNMAAALGRMPHNLAAFSAFANSVPRAVRPAVEQFLKLTHMEPNPRFAATLERVASQSPIAAKGLAGFVAIMAKMPTTKQVHIYVTRPGWVEKWITDFEAKTGKLPTQKQINFHIRVHDEATKKLREAEQHLQHLEKLAKSMPSDLLARLRGTKGDPLGAQIDAAQRKLNKLKAPKVHGIFEFAIKGDAWTKFPQQAQTAGRQAATNANKAIDTITAHSKQVGTDSGIGWASNFSAAASGNAKATITVIIKSYKKVAQISSPSRLFKKEIGDPILQGILAGLKDKKSIDQGVQTALTTMLGVFDSYKSTFQTQMGTLFAGPTFQKPYLPQTQLQETLSWGGRVTFKMVKADLAAQLHTYGQFQRDLRRLNRRRGTSFEFIDAIRQLGPAADQEIKALLHATPRQLREYERMWARSQKEINKNAASATRSQAQRWRQMGHTVAIGFMQGMQDYQPKLDRYFKHLFLSLFHTVKRTHKSHSPSLLYMEEGFNVGRGFQLGVMKGTHGLALHAPVGGFGNMGTRHEVQYHTHWTINQAKDESLMRTLRKADFLLRTRT